MNDKTNGPVVAHGRRSIGTVIAWSVIVLVTAFVMALQMIKPRSQPNTSGLDHSLFKLQAKYLVGATVLFGNQASQAAQQQLEQWKPTDVSQRIRVATVAGEVSGPNAALKRLRAIEVQLPGGPSAPSAEPASLTNILIRLYDDYTRQRMSAPNVTESERSRLQSELGWFGKLALAPPQKDSPLRGQIVSSARRTVFVILGGALALGIGGLVGLFVLLVFIVMLLSGKLSSFKCSASGHGGVYAEAFACWLVLFLVLNLAGGLLWGPKSVGSISLLSFGGSLLALAWPLVRGVTWRQLRADIGWTAGGGFVRETLAGIGCYLMALPLLIAAILLTSILMKLGADAAEPVRAPVHPVAELVASASWWELAMLLLLASVVAPIVEETMFRGLLYRHLREATGAWCDWMAVPLCAVGTGVLFAVLHPQGLLAVPGILGIAVALAFMREWRNTLVPSIIGHALNNAVTLLALVTLLNI